MFAASSLAFRPSPCGDQRWLPQSRTQPLPGSCPYTLPSSSRCRRYLCPHCSCFGPPAHAARPPDNHLLVLDVSVSPQTAHRPEDRVPMVVSFPATCIFCHDSIGANSKCDLDLRHACLLEAAGGIPTRSNSPRSMLSAAISRSPCNTWIPTWLLVFDCQQQLKTPANSEPKIRSKLY